MTPTVLEKLAQAGKQIGQEYLVAEAATAGILEDQEERLNAAITDINEAGHAAAMQVSAINTAIVNYLEKLTSN